MYVSVSTLVSLCLSVLFIALTQFFSYLTFDKRFGLVTATLVKAVHDIVPMLIILLSVLFTYSVLGCVIYGQNIEDFASVGESMSTLLIIMLGEVNAYDESKSSGHSLLVVIVTCMLHVVCSVWCVAFL